MSRVGLFNLAWGFFLVFVAACGGVFVALSLTESFLRQAMTPEWQNVLQATSHGHTALFGLIHVQLGLTLPYDQRSSKIHKYKTCGLFAGSFAMGPLMLIRAALGPTASTELNGIVIGIFLSLSLLAIGWHGVDLLSRFLKRC